MAETDTFNPSTPGALRAKHGPRWQLEEDFAQNTLDILDSGRNLRKYEAEEAANYAYRVHMSCPLDMIPDALAIREDNLFRDPPAREYEGSKYADLIGKLVADADGEGTSLNRFMRRALWARNSMGVDIVTQMTAAPEGMEIRSKADETNAGLRPFWLQFTALQKVDWATTGSNIYQWVRYSLGEIPAPSEKDGPPGIRQFLTLTPETWTKWAQNIEKQGKDDAEAILVAEGEHDLGIVPAIKFYCGESMVPGEGGVPLSLITRAAVVARCAMNLKSQADMDLLAAVARWVLKGVASDQAPDSLGPLMLWCTESIDADLDVVQGSTQPITEKREWLKMYLDEILRLLKFRGGMGDISGNQASGVKLALEMTDLRNELLSTASEMEAVETEMMRQAVVMATGDKIPKDKNAGEVLGYTVRYNKQFVLDSAADLLEYMKTWFVDLDSVAVNTPMLGKALLERFGNLLIRNDDPDAEQAAIEIEAAADVLMANDVEPTDGDV